MTRGLDKKTSGDLVRLLIFMLTTALATGVLIITIGNLSFGDTKEYAADFVDVTGVNQGDDIRIAGRSTQGVTLFHAPHYVLPPLVACRSVVTIHDCIHLMFPQYLPGRLAYVYAKGSMWSAARKANRILTARCDELAGALREVVDGVDALRLAVRERFRTGAHAIKVMTSGGVFSLADMTVVEVMTPRIDMIAIAASLDPVMGDVDR